MIYAGNYKFPYKYIALVTCRYSSSKAFEKGTQSDLEDWVAEFCYCYTEKKIPCFYRGVIDNKNSCGHAPVWQYYLKKILCLRSLAY